MKYIIAFAVLISFSALASFEQGYMSPQDIVKALYLKFGGVKTSSKCSQVIQDDRSTLGDTSPASGEISNTAPGASFLVWFDTCVTQYLDSTLYAKDSTFAAKVMGSQYHIVEEQMKKYSYDQVTALYAIQFDQLSEADQLAIISNAMTYLLGSDEEILAYGRIQNLEGYRRDLRQYLLKSSEKNLTKALRVLTQTLLKRDEFLMY